jgi:GT2 family glycosyltransferase
MRTGALIPSLGAPHLERCLEAAAALDPAPDQMVLVLSGGADAPSVSGDVGIQRFRKRLGFAAAVNAGFSSLSADLDAVAVLNDDATPEPGWLGVLTNALDREPKLASVQGTVTDASGATIDGRGIALDRTGLPVQIDRGLDTDEDTGESPVLAVSGTAGLYRTAALRHAATARFPVFDQRFGSYHEDFDLGLRLNRLGWRSKWVGGALCRHLGSVSGSSLKWRHPWWILANRWRALAGNLSAPALLGALPRLLRGELRAVRTLMRTNTRSLPIAAAVAAAAPLLVARGWLRRTPGPRFRSLSEIEA